MEQYDFNFNTSDLYLLYYNCKIILRLMCNDANGLMFLSIDEAWIFNITRCQVEI